MRLELAWGRLRRWYLKRFFSRYVQRMQAKRQGTCSGCPHEILDPRDLKFFQNVCDCYWMPDDDPFVWRDRLPLARVGLAEIVVSSCILAVLAVVFLFWGWWPLSVVAIGLAASVALFFRNPPRVAAGDPRLVMAPADGRVVAIERSDDSFVGGPAVTIAIFLSVLDVHINRAPIDARVIGTSYRPGKFLNAMRPRASRENDRVELRLQQLAPPHRCFRVRQIAGAVARRVVCWAAPGRELRQGEQFGMIKLGSRTELVLPCGEDLEMVVGIGDRVRAGSTVMARYGAVASTPAGQTTCQSGQPLETV